MKINDFEHMWTIDKEKYVLVKLRSGYGIYNQVDKTGVIIDDDEIEELVINEMLKNGNDIVEKIN